MSHYFCHYTVGTPQFYSLHTHLMKDNISNKLEWISCSCMHALLHTETHTHTHLSPALSPAEPFLLHFFFFICHSGACQCLTPLPRCHKHTHTGTHTAFRLSQTYTATQRTALHLLSILPRTQADNPGHQFGRTPTAGAAVIYLFSLSLVILLLGMMEQSFAACACVLACVEGWHRLAATYSRPADSILQSGQRGHLPSNQTLLVSAGEYTQQFRRLQGVSSSWLHPAFRLLMDF